MYKTIHSFFSDHVTDINSCKKYIEIKIIKNNILIRNLSLDIDLMTKKWLNFQIACIFHKQSDWGNTF